MFAFVFYILLLIYVNTSVLHFVEPIDVVLLSQTENRIITATWAVSRKG